MSSEAPPTYDVSIFIPSYWADQISSGFDKAYADTHYLKFPIGQGTEYIPDLVVSGTTTLGATSASSLNMGGGNITNVTNINGSAYPQAAGINAVLGAGFTAVNKDMVMAGTPAQASNTLLLNGDRAEFYNTAGSFDTGTLKRDTLTMATNNVKSILYSTGLNTLSDATTPTINNSYLSSGVLTITGSSASITNTQTPTSSVIADGTYTATLISNALSLFTNAVLHTRNAISNTGMTITGSTTSITNAITALSNIITNGTTNATINATNYLVNDTTNNRYAVLTSGGYAASGNSINSTEQALYMGYTAPSAAAGTSQAIIITPSNINIYQSNSARTGSNIRCALAGGSLTLQSSTNATMTISPTNANGCFVSLTQVDAFTTAGNRGHLFITGTSGGVGDNGSTNINLRRTKGSIMLVNDVPGMIQFFGNYTTTSHTEFGRISAIVKTITSGATTNCGALSLQTAVNNVSTPFLELNGAENQINAFKPLDMNNNSIVSSTGGITLDATGSSGTGVITLNTKNGTAGSGEGLVLSGNTLTSATASGGSSGHHLCLYLPHPTTGVSRLYKIDLKDP